MSGITQPFSNQRMTRLAAMIALIAACLTTAAVDQEELNRVLNNWGDTVAAPDLRGLNIPEPAAALLGLIGMLAVRRQP